MDRLNPLALAIAAIMELDLTEPRDRLARRRGELRAELRLRRKDVQLWLIDAGCHVVQFTGFGLVLGPWP